MLGVDGDMRLPHVLEVMVVRRRTAALDLCDDAAASSELKEEVRSSLRYEACLRGQDYLLPEAELKTKQTGEVRLNLLTLGAMYVDRGDLIPCRLDVCEEILSEFIYLLHLRGMMQWHQGSYMPRIALHVGELRSSSAKKLVHDQRLRATLGPGQGRARRQKRGCLVPYRILGGI